MMGYISPNGEKVMATITDYRQLNDALFHAGTDSGSKFEYVDEPNRLHFYIIDLRRDENGILVYKIGVRSLNGSGPHVRGVALEGPTIQRMKEGLNTITAVLRNTGQLKPVEPTLHPSPALNFIKYDIYRLSASINGQGWEIKLPNALAAVEFGKSAPVTVYVYVGKNSSRQAVLTLQAVSESDPAKKAKIQVRLSR